MTLSTHVLDVEAGLPAAGVRVTAEVLLDGAWVLRGQGRTDGDGRIAPLVGSEGWGPGTWRVVFATADHHGPDAFYPRVTVELTVAADAPRHHVPLLLSRHGYTTYRGS